jgi:Tfp pilus assembly protein PilN
VQVALRPPVATEAQAAAVNAAILQLNLPWRALHDAVKAATPPTVALLALEPDARRRTLRITAEARGSDEMLAYVDRMQRQDWFADVALTRHEINEQDPNRPIRFQLDAQWRPQ